MSMKFVLESNLGKQWNSQSGLHLDSMILNLFQTNESMILFGKIVHVTRDLWRSPGLASCSTQDQLGLVVYDQLGYESLWAKALFYMWTHANIHKYFIYILYSINSKTSYMIKLLND